MNRKSNKYFMLCCTLTILIFLYGCGSDSSTAESKKVNGIKQEDIVYVAQDISLPEYASFDGAYSDGNILYYAAADFNEASSKYQTSFYTLTQEDAETKKNFSLAEGQRVQGMAMDEAGSIYYIGYEDPMEEDGKSQSVPETVLYKLDPKGNTLLAVDLKQYTKGQEQSMILYLAIDGEGRIVLASLDQNIYVLNPDGSLLFQTRANGNIRGICDSNGKIFIGYTEDNGMAIRSVDISGRDLSAKLEYDVPGKQFYMTSNRSGTLFIATEESVYQYALETNEVIKRFDWQTYDSTEIISGILLPFGENGIMTINRSYGNSSMNVEVTAFREGTAQEAVTQEKTVITLGVPHFLRQTLTAEIVYFNKANPDYKVEVKYYEDDYDRLSTEIIAGKGPDLFVFRSNRMEQFARKGVLEDLNPYLDQEETLKRSDFLENILNAFESEGELHGVPLSFSLYTLAGKTSLLGEKNGWNLDELIVLANSIPEKTNIFDHSSKSGVLKLIKYAYAHQLVDMNNPDNPLNRELLIKMLEFSNQYEKDDQYVYDSYLYGKILGGQVMLLDTEVYKGDAYFAYSSLFEEPASFIGYPCDEGNGNLIYSHDTFAINAGSPHKDIAWKFISTLLSKEVQMRIEDDFTGKAFHIRKDALEHHFEWSKQEYEVEVYYIYVTNGEGFSYWDIPGEKRQEDIDQMRNLIQQADTIATSSPEIDTIIMEDAILYFNGSKTVEEVVDIIENRIRTYVNENN